MNFNLPGLMYIQIVNNVCKYIQLTAEQQQIFIDHLKIRKIPPKTILLREGDICQFEGYIYKGCVRTFYVNENGFEVTISFAIEDWWVSDIASFHDQKPSKFFIETLEETEMLVLTPTSKAKLLMDLPKFELFFRLLVQRNLSVLQNRLINTIAQKAPERYLDFLKLYPSIPLRVPQYYIASYLGVSAEFVSIIKKRLAKG